MKNRWRCLRNERAHPRSHSHNSSDGKLRIKSGKGRENRAFVALHWSEKRGALFIVPFLSPTFFQSPFWGHGVALPHAGSLALCQIKNFFPSLLLFGIHVCGPLKLKEGEIVRSKNAASVLLQRSICRNRRLACCPFPILLHQIRQKVLLSCSYLPYLDKGSKSHCFEKPYQEFCVCAKPCTHCRSITISYFP